MHTAAKCKQRDDYLDMTARCGEFDPRLGATMVTLTAVRLSLLYVISLGNNDSWLPSTWAISGLQ